MESTVKEAHKRNRNPKYKQRYRVTNWPEYDRSLRNRGDITLWFSEEAIQAWAPKHNGKQGRPQKFSDLTIETVLTPWCARIAPTSQRIEQGLGRSWLVRLRGDRANWPDGQTPTTTSAPRPESQS